MKLEHKVQIVVKDNQVYPEIVWKVNKHSLFLLKNQEIDIHL